MKARPCPACPTPTHAWELVELALAGDEDALRVVGAAVAHALELELERAQQEAQDDAA